jgi:hypothetical protein
MTSQPDQTHLIVDAHVHLHSCFDLAQFLDAALHNFQQQAQRQKLTQPWVGALLLAEVSGVHAFADLASQQRSDELTDWEICPTSEANSLRLNHVSGQSLLMTAGRQAVTQEGIEVLALITTADIEDGLGLAETLNKAEKADALPVLPWGVGKWLGTRGKLVRSQLKSASPVPFVGDNGGRPSFWPLPDFCQQRPHLPGSDPLPLAYEAKRAGSFGLITEGSFNWDRPGESLKQILRSPQASIKAYGRLQSPWRFVQNQSLLRLS